jgi:hypothetical protein
VKATEPEAGREDAIEAQIVAHFRAASALALEGEADEETRPENDLWPLVWKEVQTLGGRIIGFSHDFVAAAFALSEEKRLIRWIASKDFPPELSVGLAEGPLSIVCSAGETGLGLGRAVENARKLSEVARPGEVLVTTELAESARLRTQEVAPRRSGRDSLSAAALDMSAPLAEGERSSPGAADPPDEVALEASFEGAPSEPEEDELSPVSVSGEALRRCRAEKIESKKQGGLGTCRASLALAVVLSQLGRENEAILEALEGLSWARETRDKRGERACALFLAGAAERRGQGEFARAWADVAKPVEAP